MNIRLAWKQEGSLMKYEIIANEGIYIPDLDVLIKLGMDLDDIVTILKGQPFICGTTTLQYPNKKQVLECDYKYPQLGNLRLRYINNKIVSMIIRKTNNELFLDNIDLFTKDRAVLKTMLKGPTINTPNKVFYPNLALAFLYMDDKCDTILIETQEYYNQTAEDREKYYAKMSRDKDGNIQIKFSIK